MKIRCSWLLLFLVVAAVPCAADYRTVTVESLRVTFDSDWPTHTAPGYVPIRLDITNLGEARVIEIVGDGYRFMRSMYSGPGQVHIRQTLRMARGDRVRLTIPVPVSADSESLGIQIQEDGRSLEQFHFNVQSAITANDAAALIVADAGTPFGKQAPTWRRTFKGPTMFGYVAGSTRGGGTPTAPPLDLVLEPARLPANWLGYTSLRAVVIGATEWASLEDAQKDALLTWTACGGDLVIADADPAPLSGGAHRTPEASPSGAARAYFLGRIHRRTTAAISAGGLAQVLTEATSVQEPDWGLPANRWSRWGMIVARGFRLPIPGVAAVPARAYLGILVLFSLLIGPANYWLLWRKRRQVLFVLTAPIISALFILVLAGYVIAVEGLRVTGRVESFTVLDQVRKQAATRATISLYAAGMTPGGGLNFPRDVAIYAVAPDGGPSRNSQTLDLTESQRFSAGLIQARAPTNLEEIAFRPTRERLNVNIGSGVASVVNGLGATVDKLIVRRGGTVYNLTSPLGEGATATLKAGAADTWSFVPGDLPRAYRFTHLVQNLPEGAYLAVLNRSPFWVPGVNGVIERGSFHVVFGWLDGQP